MQRNAKEKNNFLRFKTQKTLSIRFRMKENMKENTFFYLLTHYHIHTSENHNELVETSGLYLRLHHITICIAFDLTTGSPILNCAISYCL